MTKMEAGLKHFCFGYLKLFEQGDSFENWKSSAELDLQSILISVVVLVRIRKLA